MNWSKAKTMKRLGKDWKEEYERGMNCNFSIHALKQALCQHELGDLYTSSAVHIMNSRPPTRLQKKNNEKDVRGIKLFTLGNFAIKLKISSTSQFRT